MRLRWRILLLGLWLGFFATAGAHAAATLVIVSSERSGAYLEVTEALMGELERTGLPRAEVLHLTSLEFSATGPLAPKLFVALGTQAALALGKAELRAPVLSTLLPRAGFERVLLESKRKVSSQFSALYLDQPLSRQLDLIELALPDVRRVGSLWGPESQGQASALKELAQSRGLDLVGARVTGNETLFPGLNQVLENSDLLLALADPQIYNSGSIQNILLASFRAKVPMMAFSPAYVRAGALLALHVSPSQIGMQAAAIARGVLQGKSLSAAPTYSQDFQVSVNKHVARSLGLSLDADELRARLWRRESSR